MTDWHAWHGQYDDPESSLSRRLRVVQQRLDEIVAGDVRQILSLCAGDGRDIIPMLARRVPERRPAAALVDIDPALAAAARRRAAEVRRWFRDAGFSEVSFDCEPNGYGVGVNRMTPKTTIGRLPRRLFSFVR